MARYARSICLVSAAMLAASLLFVVPAQASGWSRWLGPDQNGRAAGDGLFPDAEFGIETRWSRTLGVGYSGIAVLDGVAVTMFGDGEIDLLVAVGAADGKEIWRYEIGAMYAAHDGSEGGPVGMPVIDDGVVYGLGAKGHLFAVRLKDGQEIWSLRIDEKLGARAPSYGFTTTPLLVGDLLFLEAGGDEGRSLAGFDKRNGKLRWSIGDDKVGYQSPILATLAGREQIVAVTNSRILGLVPKSGKILWSHDLGQSEEDGYATAVLLGEDRFLLAGQNETKAYRVVGDSGGSGIEELWTSTHLKQSLATPILHEGHLYGFAGDFMTCIDAATGERVWKSRPPGGRGLILVDDQLFVFANDGDAVVVRATPEGYVEKARTKVSEAGSYSYPSYDNGLFFVRNTSDFAAVSVGDARGVETAVAERAAPRNDFERFVRQVEQADSKRLLVDDFMVAQIAFPIVESDRWVHFVYRGEVEDIAITGSMLEYQVEEVMHRIEGTDLYYRSYPVEPGARLEYRFNVDFENPQPDPLNPRRVAGDEGDLSEVATSGWHAPGFVRAYRGDDPGRLESFTLASEILGNERSVDVYLPGGYDESADRLPLLVVNDGKDWLEKGHLVNTLDQTIGRRVRPLIVAFVEQPQASARAELAGDKKGDYIRMLTDELLPQLEEKYRVLDEPASRAIAGVGSGALVATYAAVERPDAFGKAAGFSFYLPDQEGGGLLEAIGEAGDGARSSHWIAWNLYELRREEWAVDLARDSRRVADALEAGGFTVEAREVTDSAGWGSWRIRGGEMLIGFFPLNAR